MNIIVVDDEGIILEGETNLIRRCAPDATVTAFSSPNAALEYVRTHAVNVVFLDLEMPECHGVVLARRMKALCPHINIIFATTSLPSPSTTRRSSKRPWSCASPGIF